MVRKWIKDGIPCIAYERKLLQAANIEWIKNIFIFKTVKLTFQKTLRFYEAKE